MNITETKVKIRNLVDGFIEDFDTGKVSAYGGRLNVRPAFQREFVYDNKMQEEVIKTILKGFPLNVMYWVDCNDDKSYFEVMDGQQRTISICRFYMNQGISVKFDDEKKVYNFASLPKNVQEKFLDYELTVYQCTGSESEKLDWFRIINIAGLKLTDQELRNATYTGSWLEDAKRYFSRKNCPAVKTLGHSAGKNPFGDYLNVSEDDCLRQGLLEIALKWIVAYQKVNNADSDIIIENYMANNRKSHDASELKQHYENVMNWVKANFTVYRKPILKGQDWGALYAKHYQDKLNPDDIENRTSFLLKNDEIQNKKGIIPYILSGDETKLNLRAFSDFDKQIKYDEQKGICVKCGEHFEMNEMEGDHIVPWSKGGRTAINNLQMLCRSCNGRKSDR